MLIRIMVLMRLQSLNSNYLTNLIKIAFRCYNPYHNRFQLNISFDNQLAKDALGERPNRERKPIYKDCHYSDVKEYDQVQNAIALIEGATDTEFKISSSSTWASFIR